MKITKEQVIESIIQQAKIIQEIEKCTGKQAIEKATLQVDILIRRLTKNNLNLKKVMCL